MTAQRERLAALAFYAVVVLLAYLVYLLFRPFLVPLAWAGVLAIAFAPMHQRLERRMRPGHAALLSTVTVAVLVIVPMLAVGSAFVTQAARLLGDVPRLLTEMPGSAQRWLQTGLEYLPGGAAIDPAYVLADSARRLAAFLSGGAAAILQNIAVFVVDLVITLFALFFLFRDGGMVINAVRRIVPLDPDARERLIEQTRTLVTASVTSALIVAALQGMLGGIAFWLVGLRAPIFWGVVMAVFCVLPFGAWVIWGPAAIYLVATGAVARGLILTAVGAGIVSAIDNFLRPVLLSERTQMNGLLLFISLLGGVVAFGTVGLVLGPVLMAVAASLFDVFTVESENPPPADPKTRWN
jgi:predicted PurR-regulated permease PerM